MKTQKTKLKFILAVGTAVMLFSSCAKSELETTTTDRPYGPAREINISAEFPSLSKDKAHMDVTDHEVKWDNGDQIRINNTVLTASTIDGTKASFSGSVSPNTSYESGKDVYRSVFPKSLASSIGNGNSAINITLPESQKLLANQTDNNNYMAAISSVESGGNLVNLEFKNLCAIMKVGLKADPTASSDANKVRQIVFSAEGANLSGSAQLTFDNNGLPVVTMPAVSGERSDVYLDLTNNGQGGIQLLTSQYTYFYVMIPAASYSKITMKVINVEGKAMKKTASSQTLLRSNYYTTTSTLVIDPNENPYEFELCDGSRFVFAPGNLQYNAAQNKWRFAEHSWDIIGGGQQYDDETWFPNSVVTANNTKAADGRATQNGWIDLFGWGTSGWDAGNTLDGACYLPTDWQGVYDNRPLRPTWNGGNGQYGAQYGPQGIHNLTGTYANSDWGMYNQISTYDNSVTYPAGTWRTPTKEEWECIISLARGNNWAYACVTGSGYSYTDINGNSKALSGLLLVPKGWIDPKPNGKTFKSVISQGRAWFSDNSYTAAEMQVLMNSGAIFLPASGTRSKYSVGDCSTVGHGGISGNYWSSTAYSNTEAYSLRFENQRMDSGYDYSNIYECCFVRDENRRTFGECVRLIKSAE
jgi:hypothetical protein